MNKLNNKCKQINSKAVKHLRSQRAKEGTKWWTNGDELLLDKIWNNLKNQKQAFVKSN